METNHSKKEIGFYRVWIIVNKNYIFITDFLCLFFTDFRSGKAPILVATDVAARGLGMLENIKTRVNMIKTVCDSLFLIWSKLNKIAFMCLNMIGRLITKIIF